MAVTEGSTYCRSVHLAGRTRRQPTAIDLPITGRYADAVIEVNGLEFRVVGRGEVADRMAATEAGDWAEVSGELNVQKWKTKGNDTREQWEILATTWLRKPIPS